jgi:hypothetical protein
LLWFAITGTFQSLFALLPFFPDLPRSQTTEQVLTYANLFNVTLWKDSALYALLFQLYLSTFGEGLAWITNVLTGKTTLPLMDNPMMTSTSPSDFWGKRWNSLIHLCLKNGVYKPVRSMGGAPVVALVASFMASGGFHEWLLPSVFFDNFNITHGPNMIFFLSQAALIVIERLDLPVVRSVAKMVPVWLRPLCVIALGLPVAPWFYDTYVTSDFFQQGAVGLVTVVRLQ